MNREAVRHLDKAATHIERGEAFYRKAAEEIVAAQKADPTLSNREVARRIGRSDAWVGNLVRWVTSATSSSQPTPYSGQADAINLRKTKQLLREAPLEQVEQIVASLPKERQQAIAAAAGNSYAQARREYAEAERSQTPDDRREREQARERLTRESRQAVGGFAALGIVGHLEQAAEELRELTADASLTSETARRIRRADAEWAEALTFALQMVGEETNR